MKTFAENLGHHALNLHDHIAGRLSLWWSARGEFLVMILMALAWSLYTLVTGPHGVEAWYFTGLLAGFASMLGGLGYSFRRQQRAWRRKEQKLAEEIDRKREKLSAARSELARIMEMAARARQSGIEGSDFSVWFEKNYERVLGPPRPLFNTEDE